ncbi:MAG: hypothetical protein RIT07_1655 [Bacteroidota bacterium]
MFVAAFFYGVFDGFIFWLDLPRKPLGGMQHSIQKC